MTNWLRFGWPRWYLVRACSKMPEGRVHDWLLDFLYPDDIQLSFEPGDRQ
jgi:hypothetical protein